MREYTLFLFFVGGYEQSTYLQGYPEQLLSQVRTLINDSVWAMCWQNVIREHTTTPPKSPLAIYPGSEKSVSAQCPAINKVMYDNKIHVLKNALGLQLPFRVCRAAS